MKRVGIDWRTVDDLGKVHDHVVAARLGVSTRLVSKWRAALGVAPLILSLRDRFFAKTTPAPNGCLLWTGADRRGYGTFRIGERTPKAHRVAWELAHGPVPDGLDVCHRCDNPSCVNVDHLFVATHAENMRDMKQKGRAARGERCSRATLTEEIVREMKQAFVGGMSDHDVALAFDVDVTNAKSIRTGRTWGHVQ